MAKEGNFYIINSENPLNSETPSEATGQFDLYFSAANSVNPGSDKEVILIQTIF